MGMELVCNGLARGYSDLAGLVAHKQQQDLITKLVKISLA
jgi:hypothetical protein